MFKKIMIIAGIGLIAGCASNTKDQQPLSLEQTYQVEWIGEQPLIDRSMLTIHFGNDQRANGLAGCNNWSSNFEVDGDKIRFNAPLTTRKMCAPALMEQKQKFLKALEDVRTWRFNQQQQLELWPSSGQPIKLWLQN